MDYGTALPTVRLGGTDITRLIIGGNPFSGNSHVSVAMNEEMEDYYTTENVKRALTRSMECGINTMQLRGDKHIFRILREWRGEGGSLHWIGQTASEMKSHEGNVKQIVKNGAFAVYHHGTVTDALVKEGKYAELRDRLSVIRDSGAAVGLGTHMPEVIEYAEEHGWDIDFYMACVYNISKIDRVSSEITGKANESEPFDDEDRPIMYRTIRSTDKPCLAFKILGATRRCGTPDAVREAFEEAFANIKPTDAVIVGMFQKYGDQVAENSRIVRNIFSKVKV